jgi:hypothetical protein
MPGKNKQINKEQKMLINSLETMEKIVKNNQSLSWDGWDVINSYPKPSGWMDKAGAYIDGQWHIQKRYLLTESGWEIPTKFVR